MLREGTLHASLKRRQRRFQVRVQRRRQRLAHWLDSLLPQAALKTYLVAVILLATLPIAVLLTWKVVGDARSMRGTAVGLLQQSAASVAQAAAQDLAASTDALTALSLVDWLQQGDLEAFEKNLRETPLRRPQWRSVFLTDGVGRMLMDTASPTNAPLPRHEATRTMVFRVLARGRPAVSDVAWLGAEGTQVVVVAVPVYRDGVVQHVLGARMATATWLRLLDRIDAPEHGFIALFDSEERVLALKQSKDSAESAQDRDSAHSAGDAQSAADRRAALAAESVQLADRMAKALPTDEGTLRTAGLLDAPPVLAAWRQVDATGWKAGVGMASAPIEAAEHAIVLSALTTMGACLLLGVSLALLLAWRLTEPLQRLAAGSAVPLSQPLPVLELARLRQSLLAARQRSDAARHLLQRKAVEFETLFNHSPIGLAFAQDSSASQVLYNPAMRRLMGDSAAPGSGSTAELVYRGRVLPLAEHPLVRACRRAETVQGMEMEVRVEGRAPAYVVTNAVPLPDARGRPRGAISATMDITETRQVVALWLAADAGQQSRQRLADLAQDAGHVGFFEYRYRTDALACTPGVARLLGVPQDWPLHHLQDWLALLDARDRSPVRHMLTAAVVQGAEHIAFGCRVQPQAGGAPEHWLWCQVQVHYESDGRPGHMTGTVVDATEQPQVQQHHQPQPQNQPHGPDGQPVAPAQASARSALQADHHASDRWLHRLGHDLRNPLGAITSALEVLRSGAGGSAGAQRALDVIERQTRRLSDRVDSLLESHSAQADPTVPVPVPVQAAWDVPQARHSEPGPGSAPTGDLLQAAPDSAGAAGEAAPWSEQGAAQASAMAPARAPAPPHPAGPARLAPQSLVLMQLKSEQRQSLQTALERDGHQVTAVDNGLQGLGLLLALRPDAALLDMDLPGLDGFQLARRARAGGYAGRLVALADAGQAADPHGALRKAGFDACLSRPVQPPQWRAALRGDQGGVP